MARILFLLPYTNHPLTLTHRLALDCAGRQAGWPGCTLWPGLFAAAGRAGAGQSIQPAPPLSPIRPTRPTHT